MQITRQHLVHKGLVIDDNRNANCINNKLDLSVAGTLKNV